MYVQPWLHNAFPVEKNPENKREKQVKTVNGWMNLLMDEIRDTHTRRIRGEARWIATVHS
jgi:hypothetical protein